MGRLSISVYSTLLASVVLTYTWIDITKIRVRTIFDNMVSQAFRDPPYRWLVGGIPRILGSARIPDTHLQITGPVRLELISINHKIGKISDKVLVPVIFGASWLLQDCWSMPNSWIFRGYKDSFNITNWRLFLWRFDNGLICRIFGGHATTARVMHKDQFIWCFYPSFLLLTLVRFQSCHS